MGERVLPQAPLAGQVDLGLSPIDAPINLAPPTSRQSGRRLGGGFGTAALSLVLAACSGNVGGAAPTQTDGGSHPENPGIALTAGETPNIPESIGNRFDAFLAKYDKQIIDIDLAGAWMDFLGTPPEIIQNLNNIDYGPFYIFENPSEQTELNKYYEIIPRGADNMPQKGDILVITPNDYNPSGDLVIATGINHKEGNFFYGEVFEQFNPDKPEIITSRVDTIELSLAWAWLKLKTIAKTNGQGEVLGARTGPNLNLEFPFNGTWYYTGGPHSDGLSNGVRYAVDFAPDQVYPCPGSEPLTGNPVIASASGEVIVVGNEKKPSDPNHSIVEIKDDNGFVEGYMHLANIDVTVGDNVKTGEPLGDVSCEVPPEGKTTGEHVHLYLKDAQGNPVPIAHTVFSGYAVDELPRNYDGTLVKGDNIKTADTRRCGSDACDGIRNDVTNGSTDVITKPPPTETPAIPEFVPETPLDWARYQFGIQIFDFLNKKFENWDRDIIDQSIDLSDAKREEIIQALARGEEVTLDEPIVFEWVKTDLVGGPAVGIAYLNSFQITQERPWGYEVSNADMANGIDFKGELQISFIVKFGQIYGRGVTATNKEEEIEKITSFSDWVDGSAKAVIVSGPGFIYAAGCGSDVMQCLGPDDIFHFFNLPFGINRDGAPGNERID